MQRNITRKIRGGAPAPPPPIEEILELIRKKKKPATVEKWIREGKIDVNATFTRDGHTKSLISTAIIYINFPIAIALLEKGATVTDDDLWRAIYTQHVSMVQPLMGKGLNVNKVNTDNHMSPLTYSIIARKYDIADVLLDAGANVNVEPNIRHATPLLAAINNFHIAMSKKLIEMGADVNQAGSLHANQPTVPLSVAVCGTSLDIVKELVNKGAIPLFDDNYKGIAISPFKKLLRCGNYEMFKYIVENTPDFVNTVTPLGVSPLLAVIHNDNLRQSNLKKKFVEFLIEKGADVNKITSAAGNKVYTPITTSILLKELDILKLLIEKGADVNKKIGSDEIPPLAVAINAKNVDAMKILIDKGADINATIKIGYHMLTIACGLGFVEGVRLLIDKEVTLDSRTQTNYLKFSEEVQEELYRLEGIPKPVPKPWAKWKQTNAPKYDAIFEDPTTVNNFSTCPICLKIAIRSDGCMYMNHDCTKEIEKGAYHRELYNIYKNDEGKIYWCTLCGRIALGHRHYTLSSSSEHSKVLTVAPGSDPFDTDCSVRSGGGGPAEKYARFAAIRAAALKLGEAEGGDTTDKEAHNKLVEAAWNAPLAIKTKEDKETILKHIQDKTWNIPHTSFKANTPPPKEEEPVWDDPDLQQPAANAAALKPEVVKNGTNVITFDDFDEVINFKHRQPNGSIYNHKEQNTMISKESLIEEVKKQAKGYKGENFGHCFIYPTCKGILYPSEVKEFVPADLYEDYKKKFNKFMKDKVAGAQKGGAPLTSAAKSLLRKFIRPAENAECVLFPPRKKSASASASASATRKARGSKNRR